MDSKDRNPDFELDEIGNSQEWRLHKAKLIWRPSPLKPRAALPLARGYSLPRLRRAFPLAGCRAMIRHLTRRVSGQ